MVERRAEAKPGTPGPTEPPNGAGRRAKLAAVLAVSILWIGGATAFQLLRQEGIPASDTLWAEDGHLFLTSALIFDHPAELFVAPAGKYMHAVPRTLATIAAQLPLDRAALFFALSSSLIVAGLSFFVFHASRSLIEPWLPRAIIAGSMVLLPAAGTEVLNNAANLHYFLTFAAFWALVARPTSWWFTAIASVVVLAAAMSDPITLVMLPLAAWPLLRRRDIWKSVIAIAFLVGLVAQGLVWMSADRLHRYAFDPDVPLELQQELEVRAYAPETYAESNPLDLPRLYGLRVAGSFWAGDDLLAEAYGAVGDGFALGSLALLGALVGYGVWRKSENRGFLLLLFGFSILFFAVPVGIRGTDHVAPVGGELTFAGSRYTVVPTLLLIALATAVLAVPDPRVGKRGWRVLQTLVLVAFFALVIADFRDPNLRSGGPRWSEGLAAARYTCRKTTEPYQKIDVAPLAGFNVLVSCDRLVPG